MCKLGLNMTGIIVSRIEKRQRHVVDGELFALSKVLGVSMEWLCNGSTEPEKLPLPGSGQPEVMLDTFDKDGHI